MLDWLYTAISWVLEQWHALFSTFLDPAGGITWALSIMFLVVTIRLLLFRLFIRQVKSQRAMQEIQPEIQKLRKQYGSDRQGFSQAVMALQKERGVNPLAGCLPILPQIPVFISLFHVLRRLKPGAAGLYGWSYELTQQAATAKLFGVAPISASLTMQEPKKSSILAIPGVTQAGITTVCIVLIIVMVLTSYYTQRQIMKRSGPVEGQAAMVQKLMLYGMPLGLLVSGSLFPIGVLLYWFTNNLWTLGQQFYILKKLPPPPGSPAALAAAAAEKAAIDPKALAPKPGAKPVRGKGGRPVLPTAAPAADAEPTTGSDGATSPVAPTESDRTQGNGASPNGSTAPAPGARPPGKPKRKRR
ncbi:membrane protein insertase YidC [Petropleomorpha daqingensis]|uniref:Membrane protein insertase YidC n=1 Tax=Petropleomorpha daqingensis TaxID=2026353 RepID=A0A853CCD1_9ACTN|nr:membrane protein insertase YidC [Petropleomorpha daqingensis]NYJ05414.1 YidC/Oxa1 family membrane protein insertase [Petropleomorpha daqingensis]